MSHTRNKAEKVHHSKKKSKNKKSKHTTKHRNQKNDTFEESSDIMLDDIDNLETDDDLYGETEQFNDTQNDFNRDSDHDSDRDSDYDSNMDNAEDDAEVEIKARRILPDEKTMSILKSKINEWLDCDDKIKMLNQKMKEYKESKKFHEDLVIKMITKLGIDNKKIDVHDKQNNMRGRVYKHKSVTKGSLKEDIIKDALMEAIRDERKVNQLVKKIESKRPINERYYLKRTKGNKQ